MIVPTVWLPAFPPVPIRRGKKASNSISGKRASTQLNERTTKPVTVPARKSISSGTIRRRTASALRPCQ